MTSPGTESSYPRPPIVETFNEDDDRNGDGNEDGIGEGGGEAKKRKEPHKSCKRDVGNGGDLGQKRKKCRQEKVGSVAANPDHLEDSKEARGKAHGIQGLSKNCTSREQSFNECGGGCRKFVPFLREDGTKIALPGDTFDQPPGEMS